MCYEEEKSGVSVAEVLDQVKVGDKIRILRTGNDNDGEDRAGWEHHLFEKGQIVEVVNVSTLPEYVIAKGVSRLSGCSDTITEQGIHPLDFEAVKDEAPVKAKEGDDVLLRLPKVGDVVRVVTQHDGVSDWLTKSGLKKGGKHTGWHAYVIGDEVEVKSVEYDGGIQALRLQDLLPQTIKHDDYELISKDNEATDSDDEAWATLAVPKPEYKFKVGDRVKTENGKGTIVFITDNGNEPYLVEHDDWFDGHDGNEIEGAPTLGNSNGWYYYEHELELLAPTEASGEEIRPSASIGDKVRVLTEGASSGGNGTTLVGWHAFKKGDIVEVVNVGYEPAFDAVAPIIVKRLGDPDWSTQVLYRDDYEKVVEDSQPAQESDLPADLLEPKDLQALMALLALMPSLIGIPQENTMVNRMVTSLQYILKDYQRYLANDGEINPALKAYLAS